MNIFRFEIRFRFHRMCFVPRLLHSLERTTNLSWRKDRDRNTRINTPTTHEEFKTGFVLSLAATSISVFLPVLNFSLHPR